MTTQGDKRRITGHLEDGTEARLRTCASRLRDLQIAAAKDLEHVESSNHYALVGCGSLMEFGVRLGFGAYETRQYANLGKSLAARPELEALVRSGEVPLTAAAVIGQILGSPDLLRPGDAWVEYARTEPIKALRKRVRQRVEEHAQGIGPGGRVRTLEVSVFVQEGVKESFERARLIASRRAKRALTDGQTLREVVDCYLDAHDPERKVPGTRRLGPTGDIPYSRYIPISVRREIFQRAGGCCEAPGCQNRMFLQFAHRTPHRHGSGREVGDLLLLCSIHHTLYDAGQLDLSALDPASQRVAGADPTRSGPEPAAQASAQSPAPSPASGMAGQVREGGPALRPSRASRPPTDEELSLLLESAFPLAWRHGNNVHPRCLPGRDRPTSSLLRGLVSRTAAAFR